MDSSSKVVISFPHLQPLPAPVLPVLARRFGEPAHLLLVLRQPLLGVPERAASAGVGARELHESVAEEHPGVVLVGAEEVVPALGTLAALGR